VVGQCADTRKGIAGWVQWAQSGGVGGIQNSAWAFKVGAGRLEEAEWTGGRGEGRDG
jgi:hypothetical protein